MNTSVIICTKNRLQDLILALESLRTQTHKPHEVIVVDASDTPIKEQIKKQLNFFSDIATTYIHSVPGLTHQRNQGVKIATGEIICFFDDDIILEKNYLEELVKTFKKHPDVLGGMGTIKPNGHPITKYKYWVNIPRALFLLQRNYSRGHMTYSGIPTHPYGCTDFKYVSVLGGCAAYRAIVFKDILKNNWVKNNWFDTNLFGYAYMEDADFSYRVGQHGKLFFNPKAVLSHFSSPTDRNSIKKSSAMYVANYTYLFFKNIYPKNILKILAYLWSITGLFVEALFVARSKQHLHGYLLGLRYAYKTRAKLGYKE